MNWQNLAPEDRAAWLQGDRPIGAAGPRQNTGLSLVPAAGVQAEALARLGVVWDQLKDLTAPAAGGLGDYLPTTFAIPIQAALPDPVEVAIAGRDRPLYARSRFCSPALAAFWDCRADGQWWERRRKYRPGAIRYGRAA